MAKSFRCKIEDVYGLHDGFQLFLRPGFTALVGPNGAGKTTLLRQIEEKALERGCKVVKYSNFTDGGKAAMDNLLAAGHLNKLVLRVQSSEGQRIVQNFSDALVGIGKAVTEAIESGKTLFVLLDSLDSGTSIDRQVEMVQFFDLMERDIGVEPGGAAHDIYIVCAVNSYELAGRICVDARTGKNVSFGTYNDYRQYILQYFDEKIDSSHG